jgi:citrate lyase subunit beta/citryl-CoA lyase
MQPGKPVLVGTTLLFCPADRPGRFARAAAAADMVVLDLEDGVAPRAKHQARENLVGAAPALDPARTIVRVNAADTPDFAADLAALDKTRLRLCMLPKAESADQIHLLAPRGVLALCETARGVLGAADLAAAPETIGLMWGAEDLIAGLGGRLSRHGDGRYRDVAVHARSAVLLAAAARERPAVDAVYLDIPDLDGLANEARDAADSGFAMKCCIHPSQVPVVRDAFRPEPNEVEWARRLIRAAETADAGVFSFEGQMVDAPVFRRAQNLLDAAARQEYP